MIYKDKLSKIIKASNSNLVVGLDTDFDKIPSVFKSAKNPMLEFNLCIIEATSKYCAGYKINLAFYEAAGYKGLEALEETVKAIPRNRIKICDAKRGDIGSTAEFYARAYLDNMNFDSITVSPYMGFDSVSPFIERKDKFVYLLVRTSNKGAEDFQTLKSGNKELFDIVASKALSWSKNQIGYVIGANHLKEIKKYSLSKANTPLLIPGIGAQGNDIENLMKNINNDLFLINSSRSIIFAGHEHDIKSVFLRKVSEQANSLNNQITSLRKKHFK
ncbi:MAG: orotidine-5'-phosphate decarboxylase [Candidatus Kapaibacterium sp.]